MAVSLTIVICLSTSLFKASSTAPEAYAIGIPLALVACLSVSISAICSRELAKVPSTTLLISNALITLVLMSGYIMLKSPLTITLTRE
jgi:drug/metabolite transporter (DMT)-like permease